jgi:hypothetical protein
MDWMWDKNWVD